MDDLKQLVAGGALTLLLLREVFAFLKTRKTNGNGSGEKSVDYWRSEIGKIVKDEMRDQLQPIREDTKATRTMGHDIISALTGIKGALEIMVGRPR